MNKLVEEAPYHPGYEGAVFGRPMSEVIQNAFEKVRPDSLPMIIYQHLFTTKKKLIGWSMK